ncbi:MAG: hypothetical protein ACP5D0_08845 [Hydrogenovibrio sp.]
MSTLAFDTHSFVKRLKQVGFSEEQAEVFAEEQKRLIEEQLATKKDLKELELNLIIKLGSVVMIGMTVLAVLVKVL